MPDRKRSAVKNTSIDRKLNTEETLLETVSFDPTRLEDELQDRFGGSAGGARTVARQAADLADAGRYEADTGRTLTTELVLAELSDASGTPPERWNWWIGSLEVAYGGYERFGVRRYHR